MRLSSFTLLLLSCLIPLLFKNLRFPSILFCPSYNLYAELQLYFVFFLLQLFSHFTEIACTLPPLHNGTRLSSCIPPGATQSLAHEWVDAPEILLVPMNTLPVHFTASPEFKVHSNTQFRTLLFIYSSQDFLGQCSWLWTFIDEEGKYCLQVMNAHCYAEAHHNEGKVFNQLETTKTAPWSVWISSYWLVTMR